MHNPIPPGPPDAPRPARWPDAVLAGFASSMRTTAGPAALAARGRITGKARAAALVAGAGELALDKSPAATDRTDPAAVGGRMAAGAYTGHALAGPAGVAAGAAGAFAGTYATWRARKLVVAATGLPDPVVAVGEDLVALTAAAIATRPAPPEPGEQDGEALPRVARTSVLAGAAKGLAAGLVGTAAMTIAQGAEYVITGAQPSDAPATVADKLSRALGRGRIKRKHKPAANQLMHWGYGTSWGIPFGIVASSAGVRPEVAGPVFGGVVYAAGLVQQPALGVADPPWERSVASLGSEAFFHLVYGIGAGAALRALQRA